MPRGLYGLALPLALALAACAGEPCSFSSPCPNDTPPTQSQRDSCRATLRANETSPCYGEIVAVLICSQNNTVCGGDGRTDSALSTTRAQNNCAAQISNARACCARTPTASACR